MPNYASIRVSLIGPTTSIQRFKRLCIRVPRGEDTKSFDFEGLLPMPEAVAATLTDRSQPAQARAMAVCGFSGWYDWSLENWGVKWNAGGYYEIRSEPTRLEFNFEAAWSHPEPVFHELARQCPDIDGEVFVAEPGMDWGAVGFLHAGSYQDHQVDLTAKLKHLACEWSGPAEFKIPRIHSVLDVMRYLDRRWVEIHAHLRPERQKQLNLAINIGAALDEADSLAAERLFQHLSSVPREVEMIGNVRFDETCFATNLGRELMRILADKWMYEASSTQVMRTTEALCARASEVALREWIASVADNGSISSLSANALRRLLAHYAEVMTSLLEGANTAHGDR